MLVWWVGSEEARQTTVGYYSTVIEETGFDPPREYR